MRGSMARLGRPAHHPSRIRTVVPLLGTARVRQTGRVICQACRERRHEACRGGSWCDCQHQSADRPVEPATGPPGE